MAADEWEALAAMLCREFCACPTDCEHGRARKFLTLIEARVQQRETAAGVRALREAATSLRAMATERFDTRGPQDPRGAAIWDAAEWLVEKAEEDT